MSQRVWIDILNPSHPLIFGSIVPRLRDANVFISVRDRAETVELMKTFGLEGTVIGCDYRHPIKKVLNLAWRTLVLYFRSGKFDATISFENGSSILVAKLQRKKSILMCDNDLKFKQMTSGIQDVESKIKLLADYIIIPQACYPAFSTHVNPQKILTYAGYKEDLYVATYTPDADFMNSLPFRNYVVIRPEALGSFYVTDKRSIVPELLALLLEKGVSVVYLPREIEDYAYAEGFDVYIPPTPLNGLDLCYYANAVLTGSGTMAREAACLGRKSVSFFPGENLLSVDQALIDEGRIFHSRNAEEIVQYVFSDDGVSAVNNSKAVLDDVMGKINGIISEV